MTGQAFPYLTIPAVNLQGDSFSAGREKGKTMQIWLTHLCRSMINEHHDAEWVKNFLAQGELSLKRIADAWSGITKEIEGVAAGASIPPEYLAALFTNQDLGEMDFCTNLIFANTPQGPLWGGNFDGCLMPLIELRNVAGAYRNITCYGNPRGLVNGCGGINEHGLMIGASGASPGTSGGRIPGKFRINASHYHGCPGDILPSFPTRIILDTCKNVNEALELFRQAEFTGRGNHLLADESGHCVLIERCGNWMYLHPEIPEGAYCGNLTASMLDPAVYDLPEEEILKENSPAGWPGIWQRFQAAKAAVTANPARHSLEFLKATMTGHQGDITRCGTICNWATGQSYIGICRERKLLAAMAPPCLNPYIEYQVPVSY